MTYAYKQGQYQDVFRPVVACPLHGALEPASHVRIFRVFRLPVSLHLFFSILIEPKLSPCLASFSFELGEDFQKKKRGRD
jgi:hypothetical protein